MTAVNVLLCLAFTSRAPNISGHKLCHDNDHFSCGRTVWYWLTYTCLCVFVRGRNKLWFLLTMPSPTQPTDTRPLLSLSLSYIEDPNYYKGTSFLNMGRKLCTFILNNHLSKWTEETNVIEEINPQSHVHTVCTTTTSLTKKKYIYIVYRFSKGIWLCFSI